MAVIREEITLITYSPAHRYNNDVKHIKILTREGCFYIAENRKFRSILVSSSPSPSPCS